MGLAGSSNGAKPRGWNAWPAHSPRNAVWTAPLTRAEIDAGCVDTLCAATECDLAGLIAEQEWLRFKALSR